MNLFDTVFKTISAPFSAFFPKKYPYTEGNVRYTAPAPITQPQQTVYSAARPQPPQTLSPSQEQRQIELEMGLTPSNVDDKTALSYLPKSKQALAEFRSKKQFDVQGYQKLNQGLTVENQKQVEKERIGENAYATEQLRRSNNANQVRAQHDAEEQPYLDWMNQMQNIQNKMTLAAPTIPIKFQ